MIQKKDCLYMHVRERESYPKCLAGILFPSIVDPLALFLSLK